MRHFDYKMAPEKLLTPEIVQMIGSLHEHKGKQELLRKVGRADCRNEFSNTL